MKKTVKTVKKYFAAVGFLTICGLALGGNPVHAQDHGGDEHRMIVERSQATFSVSHLYVAHVQGVVPLLDARVVVQPGSTVPTSFHALLDPRHVHTDDEDRDADLQSKDWFDTARFPTWTYESGSVRATPSGWAALGQLTIHGVSRPVTLIGTTIASSAGLHYQAVTHIDRHAFGMSLTPQDALIGSDVEIHIDAYFR